MFKKYTRGEIKKIDQLKKKNKGIFYSFIRLLWTIAERERERESNSEYSIFEWLVENKYPVLEL